MTAVREVPGLTIDDVSTRDIDDAFAIERLPDGWKVFVSIADVSRDVPLGSENDLAAYQRTATRYYASGNSPMLPHELSEHLLSLWPKVSRFVITVEMTLSESFETRHVDIYEAGIRSEAKLSYDQIPAILANPEHPHHTLLKNARGLGLGLLTSRRAAGALVMYDLNNGWVTTEEGSIRKLANKDEVIGHIIIQELMIRTNLEVANFGVNRGIPLLFRNHEAHNSPDRAKLLQAIQEAAFRPIEGLDELRAQTHLALKRAVYSSVRIGHYGLNLPAYLHFTSPIRRYADLVNHRQIVATLRGTELAYSEDEIEEIAQFINAKAETDRTATSEAMKDKATKQAQRAIDSRRIDGLSPKDFERVVKVEVRRGETDDASEALFEVLAARLPQGAVPLLCLKLLFEAPALPRWTTLREKAIAWVATKPEDAVSIFGLGSQGGWPAVEFSTTEAGPDHQKTFSTVGRLGDHAFEARASTSKVSKQRAATGLLALFGSVAPPVFEDVPVTPTSTESEPADATNPVGQLQEYCQLRSKPLPTYVFAQNGPSHLPVVTCTCRLFNGTEKTAVGNSKKDAKRRAAEAVVKTLG